MNALRRNSENSMSPSLVRPFFRPSLSCLLSLTGCSVRSVCAVDNERNHQLAWFGQIQRRHRIMIVQFLRSVAACLALAVTTLAGAQNISIATGGTGGVYYPMGGGMAAVLSKYVPGMQATAEVTGGSVDNLKLIGSGKPYVGFSMTDAGLDALKGEDKFKGNKIPVRTLMVLYPNRMHVVSIEGTGVTRIGDIKGKRVSTGSGGSATE